MTPVVVNQAEGGFVHPISSNHDPEIDLNFVTRVRDLVNRMLEQLSRTSENDRKQVETLKREYRVAAQSAADMQIRIGNAAPWVAAVGFAMNLSQFMVTNPDDRGLMKYLSEQVPGVGSMWTSGYMARQMEFGAVRDLRSTEINLKNSKTQSESGAKQEFLALLNSTLDAMKKASS